MKSKKVGRPRVLSDEERRARAAAYQREWRAKHPWSYEKIYRRAYAKKKARRAAEAAQRGRAEEGGFEAGVGIDKGPVMGIEERAWGGGVQGVDRDSGGGVAFGGEVGPAGVEVGLDLSGIA